MVWVITYDGVLFLWYREGYVGEEIWHIHYLSYSSRYSYDLTCNRDVYDVLNKHIEYPLSRGYIAIVVRGWGNKLDVVRVHDSITLMQLACGYKITIKGVNDEGENN